MKPLLSIILMICFLIIAANAEVIPFVREEPLALQPDASAQPIPPDVNTRILDDWLNIRINSDTTGQVQNEQQIVVNPRNPANVIAVWRDFRLGYRRVGVGRSFDGGFTWEDELFIDPNFEKQSDPGLAYHSSGIIYAVNLSYNTFGGGDALMVANTTNGGMSWSPWVPAVSNYDPDLFEDKELMTCDRSGSQYDGNLYIAWSRFEYLPYTQTTITLVRSTDGGLSWDDEVPVSDEHGVQWPVPVVGPEGEVYVGWVKYYDEAIRFDRSFDGGVTWGNDIIVQETAFASAYIYPQLTIFCFPAMDVDITNGPNRGTIYIAYCDDWYYDTDIFFTKSIDQGESWSAPTRINDDVVGNGADQFHPWLVCDENGVLHLIFYDRRLDLPNNLYMDLFYTYSTDAGATWSPNERITEVSSNPAYDSTDSGLIGEYNGLAVYNNVIHPVWTDTRNGHQDTYTAVWDTTTSIPGYSQNPLAGTLKALLEVSPNPFNSAIEINLNLPQSSSLELSVVDLSGRKIVVLADGVFSAGVLNRVWQPYSATGIYFIRAVGADINETKKVLYLK